MAEQNAKNFKKNTHIHFLLKSLFLFLFFYDIALNSTGTLFSTRKVSFVILIIYIVSAEKIKININIFPRKIKIQYFFNFLTMAAVLSYLIIAATFNNVLLAEGRAYPYYIYFTLWVLIAPWLLTRIYRSAKEFCQCLITITCVQVTICFLQHFSYSVRVLLETYIYDTGNMSFLATHRLKGLAGYEGAALSVVLMCGVIACAYLIITERCNLTLYWLVTIYIMIGTLMTGRTGFYFEILILTYVIINEFLRKKIKKGNLYILILAVALSVVCILPIHLSEDESATREFVQSRTEHLVTGISEGKNSDFFRVFDAQEIPELSLETIVGTGIRSGDTNTGLFIRHDSGYVKSYASLGLVLAVIVYLSWLSLFIGFAQSIKRKDIRYLLFLCIGIFFIAEYKEPFMLYYHCACIYLCLGILLVREQSGSEEEAKK